MNWKDETFTNNDGQTRPGRSLEIPGWSLFVRQLKDGKFVLEATSWSEWSSPKEGQRLFDTIEEGQAAAVPWLRQLILERLTAQARALGGRVVDVDVDDALLVYDDSLCPKCNDGSRIDWNYPSDPVNDLYTCGRHEFDPSDLQVLATERKFGPGRILLVHFPEPENEEAQ